MRRTRPLRLRHGPLTVYLSALEGCPDPLPLIQALPPQTPVIWLDSAREHPVTGRWSIVAYDPWLVLVGCGDRMELRTSAATHRWRGHPLDALRLVLRRYRATARSQPQARAIGLTGFFSYELNRWIEALPPPQPGEPAWPELLWCGMRVVVLLDHLEQRGWLISVVDPHAPQPVAHRQARDALERAEGLLRIGAHPVAGIQPSGAAPDGKAGETPRGEDSGSGLEATSSQAGFEAMVARALEHIRAGEIFQANVSQRFTAPWRAPGLPLYLALRRINPSPFACYLSYHDLAVVSSSPERLVRAQEGRLEARPMAGTRPRGATSAEDLLNGLDLLLSEKERAEHLMLVDLARNDLGRVCAVGSVSVDELMTLEEYSHVLHIVSNVSGVLRRGCDAVDIIRAVFPGGTITGCPKVRCMQLLRELEPVARGLYTGSLGTIGFDGTMDLNIAIRTMMIRGGQLSFHVGAGIVADSDPAREYQETMAKAGALMAALQASPHADACRR